MAKKALKKKQWALFFLFSASPGKQGSGKLKDCPRSHGQQVAQSQAHVPLTLTQAVCPRSQ